MCRVIEMRRFFSCAIYQQKRELQDARNSSIDLGRILAATEANGGFNRCFQLGGHTII